MDEIAFDIQPGARFRCHRCGACCVRDVGIALVEGDLDRISAHDWTEEGARFRGGPLEPRVPGEPARLRTHEGRCLFLDEDQTTCLIHARLSAAAKPARCQAFPLRFTSTPDGIGISVAPECMSLHRSFTGGEPVVADEVTRGLALRLGRLMIVGDRFILRSGEPPRLGWAEVRAVMDDAGQAALDDAMPLGGLPWALRRVIRRAEAGAVPKTPWSFEGPRDMPFYQCLDYLGEALSPLAQGFGLSLLASSFASLRRYQAWRDASRRATERGARFARFALSAWIAELRPLQLGQVTAGLGTALYLTMASVVGARSIAGVERNGAPPDAVDVNRVTEEATVFYRLPETVRVLEEHLLAFERLIFDAPEPELPPQEDEEA